MWGLAYKYFDGGLGACPQENFENVRVISVGFAQTFLKFLGLGPRKILRIRPS